jgi:hypothetical protein
MTIKTKSSKEKGSEFEREFAQFMKDELGYDDCFLNEKVKGKLSTNEYEVDIIGKKLSKNGEILQMIGRAILVMGLMLLGLHFLNMLGLHSQEVMYIVGAVGLGWLLLRLGKEGLYEYTWVECKAHKSKIGKDYINHVNSNVGDYHDSDDKKWEFKEVIFASKSGFIPNSLRFAREFSIRCYSGEDGSLHEVKASGIH